MQKFTKYGLIAVLALSLGAIVADAQITSRVGTATLMSDLDEGSTTVTVDDSVRPTGQDRSGYYHIHYAPVGIQAVGAHDLWSFFPDAARAEIEKGTILLEDAIIEVQTAISPTYLTNYIGVGGVDILASSATALASTGIKAAVVAAQQVDTNDVPYIVLGGAASNMVFDLYLPVYLGNDQ